MEQTKILIGLLECLYNHLRSNRTSTPDDMARLSFRFNQSRSDLVLDGSSSLFYERGGSLSPKHMDGNRRTKRRSWLRFS